MLNERPMLEGDAIAVRKPDPALVKKIAGSVCTAMTLAGVEAYERWATDPANIEREEWADLVISVYAAMRAQRLALEAQISAEV